MDRKIHIEILTPYGKYLAMEADYLSVGSALGVIGILPNHAPLITTILTSKLSITSEKKTLNYAISGGLLHVKEGTVVTILANAIERSDEIDVQRAIDAQLRAENRLKESGVDVTRARAALARALNRINISKE